MTSQPSAFVDRVLREAGCHVAVAPNGPDALRVVDQHPPFDGFVLDVRMPEMHGDELARRLRQRDPEAKVLYLNGYSGDLLVTRNSASPGREDAILKKPATVQALLDAVSRLLGWRHRPGPTRWFSTATGPSNERGHSIRRPGPRGSTG